MNKKPKYKDIKVYRDDFPEYVRLKYDGGNIGNSRRYIREDILDQLIKDTRKDCINIAKSFTITNYKTETNQVTQTMFENINRVIEMIVEAIRDKE